MSEKILIVDDDEFIRSITQDILQEEGYSVEVAEDGQAAWERLQAEPDAFDLMLLDKKMPRMDGIALLHLIKTHDQLKDLPVIMLTGDTQQQDVVEGLAAGAYYYLTKPSTEEMLKRVIRNALNELGRKSELRALLGRQQNNLRIMVRAEFRFQRMREARELALLLAEASHDPQRTVNGYSELLINAVEHGNLDIDYAKKSELMREGRWHEEIEARLARAPYAERWVDVLLEQKNGACVVTIRDEGAGFDWENYLDFTPERAFDLHGRGIAMSRKISFDHMEYQGKGNVVVVTVNRPGHA